MALWEYKVISSGKGGFATPALLESFLNQIGKEEWEIIEFRTQPDNVLAFHGLARRPTQRDWTLEAAAAAAARAEADKLRAEFAAKFQAASGSAPDAAADAEPKSEGVVRDDSFRRPRDTENDLDPDAIDESAEQEQDEWPEEDHLPTFFEAIRPHMRRNQKGPGHSVGLEYLIKKFDMVESDLHAALQECGFVIPEDEDDKPVYLDFDGDLYWLNINRRGEMWINAREKPRPVFRAVKGTQVVPEQAPEKPQMPERERKGSHRQDQQQQPKREVEAEPKALPPSEEPAKTEASEKAPVEAIAPKSEPIPSQPVPTGLPLLEKIRPLMRRSRGGWSGTMSFLSRALQCSDTDLITAFGTLGLTLSATSGDKPHMVELEGFSYWLNRDGRGGVWINARDARRMRQDGRSPDSPKEAIEVPASTDKPSETPVVVAITSLDGGNAAPSAEVHAVAVAAAISALETEEPSAHPTPPVPAPTAVAEAPTSTSAAPTLAGLRLLLKELKPGSFAMELGTLSRQLGKSDEELAAALAASGLKTPDKPREKAIFVEHAGEVFWLNRNAKGELWLNAKASKYPEKQEQQGSSRSSASGEKKLSRRAPRGARKPR